jgi:hypothetical protein
MDMTPKADSVDPGLDMTGYVPGWTARGYSQLDGILVLRRFVGTAREVLTTA